MDFNQIQYLGVYNKIHEVKFKLGCTSTIQSTKIKLRQSL
jgi:hypothetical protein